MNWDRRFKHAKLFEGIFLRLVERARSRANLWSSAPVDADFSLRWLVRNQAPVQQALVKFLRGRDPELGATQKITVVTDKAREIYVSSWPDRVLLMAVGQLLAEIIEPLLHVHLYSFRKGRGPVHALRDAAEYLQRVRAAGHAEVYALKRDVSKYGDTIPQAPLLARLGALPALADSPVLHSLVRQAVRPRVGEGTGEYCLCLGIPSGSPLVPPLENFYLLPLDEKLLGFKDCFYGRYGDDFICLTTSRDTARRADSAIDEEIARLGLRIKPEKKVDHVFSSARGGLSWLGKRLNWPGQLGPKPEHLEAVRRRLRSEVYSLVHRSCSLPSELRPRMLRRGLLELLDLRVEARLAEIVWRGDLPQLVGDLQKDLMEWLVDAVAKSYRLRRRAAWRLVKRLPVPSLELRRRVYRARKAKCLVEGGFDATAKIAA